MIVDGKIIRFGKNVSKLTVLPKASKVVFSKHKWGIYISISTRAKLTKYAQTKGFSVGEAIEDLLHDL